MEEFKLINGEIFKTINEFKDFKISSFGRCIMAKTKQVKKHNVHIHSGYHSVGFTVVYHLPDKTMEYSRHRKQVHLLVAEHFLPNPNNYKYVKHIDGNLSNNHVDNLQWMSDLEHFQGIKVPKNKSGHRGDMA